MSLDYWLDNCEYKTNGDLMDAISAKLDISEKRAGELIFNICVAIAIAKWKLDDEKDVEIIMERLAETESANIVNRSLLRLAIGIKVNVIPE